MASIGKKPSLREKALQHLILFFFGFVFPGLTTMIAPATWISFSRSNEAVRCTTRTCVFFIVPFKVQQVDRVTEIQSREREARTEKKRKLGRETNEKVHVDGEGFLQILGEDGTTAEVSVSPASLASVVERCNRFLGSPNESHTTLFAIANWKFGAIMGGVLTSLTVLCVVGYSLALLQALARPILRLLRPA